MAGEVIDIQIIGIPQTQQFFNVKAPNAIKGSVSISLQGLNSAIETTTKGIVPVDTGALQASIEVTSTDDTLTAHAGEDYASYVDRGTSKMSAQPFFEEPIRAIANTLSSIIEQKLQGTGIFSE